MKLVVDTHTHTISSGHSFSTFQEMARYAADNGIECLAITDHGPDMTGAPRLIYFNNLRRLPESLYGVKIVKGVEANIIDYNGNTDIPVGYLKKLQFAIASLHPLCIKPVNKEAHTKAAVEVLSNPYIDVLAHPGNPAYPLDIDEVVKTAKKYNKLIELNNQSFSSRAGCEENCLEFAKKCAEYGVRIVCGSDAHISFEIGVFDKVMNLLEMAKVPKELVLNTSVEKFEAYLQERKERISLL